MNTKRCIQIVPCKKHASNACEICIKTKGSYPDAEWDIEWCCNTRLSSKMYVLNSGAGFVMTTMKALPKEKI